MGFMKNYLTKIDVLNVALIVIGVAYDIARLFFDNNVYTIIAIALQLVAYCFALNYVFKRYSKKAAESFKMFLYGFGLSMIATVISTIIAGRAPLSANIQTIIRIICIVILAFVKDLGKTKSYALSCIIFVLSTYNIISQMINTNFDFKGLIMSLCGFILSTLLCIFVFAKYREKESRGTK